MSLRVFLVEDSSQVRSLIHEAVESIGGVQMLGSATNEAEANYWLQENVGTWDVAILDLVLDQGSGLGIVGKIGPLRGRGQLVVFSGFASSGVRDHCLRLGADAVFDKAHTAEFLQWLYAAAQSSPTT